MDDVYPRRNLNDAAEHWGRTLETRADRAGKRTDSLAQLITGDDRSAVSQLSELQRQAEALRSDLLATPISLQRSGFASNFGIGSTWTTVASANFTVPAGKSTANVIARATANVDWVAANGGGGGGERFNWPFSLGTVSQEYGPNGAYDDGMHKGIDFAVSGGTPIVAPGSGTVTTKTYDSERGNYIIIDHGGGLSTWYYHLQAPSPLSVGWTVTKGDTVVGYVGTTGFSTGNHLHWETRVNGNHMNPRDFMAQYANGGPSTSVPFDFLGRILISGWNLRDFRGSREPVSGDVRIFGASGRTFTVSPQSTVSVQFQLISTNGLNNPPYEDTYASVIAFGVFA